MYTIINHPLIKEDMKKLNRSIQIQVLKKLKQLALSPELGKPLGNKGGLNLTGLRKVYVVKKQVRIVYEIIDDMLVVKVVAIGKREEMQVYKEAEKRK
jgi:mRNA interferase RelE/StbE